MLGLQLDAAQTDGTVHGDIRRGQGLFHHGGQQRLVGTAQAHRAFAGNFRCTPGQRVRHALGISGCPGVLLQRFFHFGKQAVHKLAAVHQQLFAVVLLDRGHFAGQTVLGLFPVGDERVAPVALHQLVKVGVPLAPGVVDDALRLRFCRFNDRVLELGVLLRRFHAAHVALLLGCFLIHARHLKF